MPPRRTRSRRPRRINTAQTEQSATAPQAAHIRPAPGNRTITQELLLEQRIGAQNPVKPRAPSYASYLKPGLGPIALVPQDPAFRPDSGRLAIY